MSQVIQQAPQKPYYPPRHQHRKMPLRARRFLAWFLMLLPRWVRYRRTKMIDDCSYIFEVQARLWDRNWYRHETCSGVSFKQLADKGEHISKRWQQFLERSDFWYDIHILRGEEITKGQER